MSTPLAIETRDLPRAFGTDVAVDRLNLSVPRGGVYGFLGPNGAGKTTTIRMLLGLMMPTRGDVRVEGRVGAMVEGPSLYPNLTAEENLEVTRRLLDVPRDRIGAVLVLFGLTPHRRQLVRSFSTGMRQQLGLALAWLGDPDLLVLDEPANGLDPAATRSLRAC
jgi:ABC-2 type transport system ATP-binding protein